MIIREQQLQEQYGFKTCKGRDVPDRFMKGLPSSTLPVLTNLSKENVKSLRSLRDFEALNGIGPSRLQGNSDMALQQQKFSTLENSIWDLENSKTRA